MSDRVALADEAAASVAPGGFAFFICICLM
jgi:hypothetical protein